MARSDLGQREPSSRQARAIVTRKGVDFSFEGCVRNANRACPQRGLHLLIAAIIYWNPPYISDAVVHLRSTGEIVPSDLPAQATGRKSINFSRKMGVA
jgi:Tn3 transposase DDE domain